MEKDIGRIKKNDTTDIVIRVDDFGGRIGLTIREFVNESESGYSGFTKSGTRIPIESFDEFKTMINSIKPEDLRAQDQEALPQEQEKQPAEETPKESATESGDNTI